VITGKDAEAAGVDRQALVKTELCTEVGNQVGVGVQVLLDKRMGTLFVVGVISREDTMEVLHEHAVTDCFLQSSL